MRAHLDDIDFAEAARQEARVRHDVMAHLHTFAKAAPKAKPIIHLGATSMDIVDNTDVLLTRDALEILARKTGQSDRCPGSVCHQIPRSALPGLHAPAARAAHHRRQAGGAVDLRFRACAWRISNCGCRP